MITLSLLNGEKINVPENCMWGWRREAVVETSNQTGYSSKYIINYNCNIFDVHKRGTGYIFQDNKIIPVSSIVYLEIMEDKNETLGS